ncbi:hypothetical protein [Enterococcus aquimarinus]|uniref:Uncharacterized protein n=1 Tax=Enterococcus aquimarinus TaxID=328396 RepID=A0A1L8QUF1_9ENTE|nr:hypothetical protein [Enterococcus aquimarinus]OJG11120.1 hypothetical protein RU93_GL001607 [Enterococcus aquimarinus]
MDNGIAIVIIEIIRRILAECYLSDERFSDYYNNRAGKDAARTLTAIIQHYA